MIMKATPCSPLKVNRRFGGTYSLSTKCTTLYPRRYFSLFIVFFFSFKEFCPLACSYLELVLKMQMLWRVGRTPFTGDQPVARTLPITDTEETRTDIHLSDGIRKHDSSVWSGGRHFVSLTARPL
jgi:hypothetical protein